MLIICTIALIVVIKFFNLPNDILGEELAKSLMQVIVVLFLGQLISFIIAEYNRSRQKSIALNEYRKEFLSRIIQLYVDGRKVQKSLRTDAHSILYDLDSLIDSTIDIQKLNQQMHIVNDIIFELMYMENEIKTFGYAFSNPDQLISDCRYTRKYFEHFYTEYQQILPELASQKEVKICEFQTLVSFLGSFHKSEERKNIEEMFRSTIKSIQSDILAVD